MQMTMFDPREYPVATAEILADKDLRGAITAMRNRCGLSDSSWPPYIEAAGELAAVRAWAVEDGGVRYVVGRIVFDADDLEILNRTIQQAARDVFSRLDAGAAP